MYMNPLLDKTAHSWGGRKVNVGMSRPSPSFSKIASSSSHGKLYAAAFENPNSFLSSGRDGISFTMSRRNTKEGFLLLVTTAEASALLSVMRSKVDFPTTRLCRNVWHDADLPICCVYADILVYSFQSWGQNGFSQ